MSDAPDFIWAKTTLGNTDEGYWEARPILPNMPENQGTPYVRRDIDVLAELPEVKALVVIAIDTLTPADAKAALDAYVAAEVRKALDGAAAALWDALPLDTVINVARVEVAQKAVRAMIPEAKP